ncbi:ribonuclease H-like domain-containing protein [Vallitalea sp.]|jgi:uncharacterized protein YprB with RNaseH-like and TPR domain|uniref:ribonuclease H-like domain-containing protein n=1 Tax=Vallitalea sp. TaxID=1882829 RepID=UPI0025D57409|nr:ribonuclease H-like domain-containing protein [Vallitalea sp.]MCT4688322.1 ribonuclease H-like domain-containing protein [Vallitalea sp.]
MILINKNVDMDTHILKRRYANLDDLLFFDIETTGFSYRRNIVYLIGCIYFIDEMPTIIQWLADNENDEYAVLYEFIKFSNNFNKIIHYNGTSFDIPFITKKALLYKIDNNLSYIENIDIYKLVRPCKHVLNLENCKLKTIEKYLNIFRKDTFTGGELIRQYIDFTESKSDREKTNLLLHNEEDLTGLIKAVKILDYVDTYNNLKHNNISYKVNDIDISELIMTIRLSTYAEVPFDYSFTFDNYYIHINHKELLIKIQLLDNELKFFFNNYKDYYYIHSEDQAVHKHVAMYIDKSNKTKATSETCYIKKRGIFIPLLDTYIVNSEKIFYISKKNKTKYVQLQNDIHSNISFIDNICTSILKSL